MDFRVTIWWGSMRWHPWSIKNPYYRPDNDKQLIFSLQPALQTLHNQIHVRIASIASILPPASGGRLFFHGSNSHFWPPQACSYHEGIDSVEMPVPRDWSSAIEFRFMRSTSTSEQSLKSIWASGNPGKAWKIEIWQLDNISLGRVWCGIFGVRTVEITFFNIVQIIWTIEHNIGDRSFKVWWNSSMATL